MYCEYRNGRKRARDTPISPPPERHRGAALPASRFLDTHFAHPYDDPAKCRKTRLFENIMQILPLKGSISDIFFPRLVAQLHREGFEGVLRVNLGATTKVVYFKQGEIASAASNAEADRLASVLIQAGRLTREQLDLAKSRLQAGGSLGKTLIEMGFLTPTELLQGAREQVRQILASAFTLSSGKYGCEPGPLPPQVTVLGIATMRLIFDSLMQARDRQWILRELGSMESVYIPSAGLNPGLEELKLDTEMDRLARSLDGLQTLRDHSGHTSLDDFTVGKLCLALEVLGMAEKTDAPATVGSGAEVGRRIEIDDGDAATDAAPFVVEDAQQEIGTPPEAGEEVIPFAPAPVALDPPEEGTTHVISFTPEPGTESPTQKPETPVAEVPGSGPAPIPLALDEQDAPDAPGDAADSPATAGSQDDTPSFPSEELPAFARPATSEPDWQVDPETGEKVHVGPVQVTFDGRVSSGGGSSSRRTIALIGTAAAVLAVSGGILFYLIFGRDVGEEVEPGGVSPVTASVGSVREQPAPPPAPEETGAPTEDTPTNGTSSEEVARNDIAPEPDVESSVDPEPLIEPPQTGTPPVEASPILEEPPPGPPPRGSVSPFRDTSRYAVALRTFDGGDAAKAALIFRELVAEEDPGRLTLQLMIACEANSLRGARSRSGDTGSFFFVPFDFKGRSCYRACWGIYRTTEQARSMIPRLPSYFSESGIRPVVVSTGKLTPPS